MEKLGWKAPVYKHWGRINFEGMRLSTSKTRIAIEQGEYTGWDDIRLATLKALRRRGYQKEALQKFATEIGLSLTDKTVTQEEFWKQINAFNKEVVEPLANRFFFVKDPKEVFIEGLEGQEVQLALHPEDEKRGSRTLKITETLLIAKSDFLNLEDDKVHRLIDLANFTKQDDQFTFHSTTYEEYKNAEDRGRIIHFLPNDPKQLLDAEIMQLDHSIAKGKIEASITKQKVCDIVQLERQHFARIDMVEDTKVSLWYLHK